MAQCALCRCESLVECKKDILLDKIGKPPIPIIDILVKITYDHQFTSTEVCNKCTNKITQYYEAIQTAEQIKHELLQLIHKDPLIVECLYVSEEEEEEAEEDECIESSEIICPIEVEEEEQEEKYDIKPYIIKEENIQNVVPKKKHTKKMKSEIATTTICNKNVCEDEDQLKTNYELEGDEINKQTFDCSTSKGISMYHSSGIGQPIGIQCEICDRVFKYARTFHAHKKYNGFVGYICEICGIQCLTKAGIKDHAKVHKPDKEFHCTQCDAQFHRKFLLKQHMAYHTNETPFQCEICAKCFVHRVALNVHKKIHTDQIRRFNCQMCDKKFRSVTHLRRHMAIHTGAKPFSCPICNNRFSQAYNMKAHMKLHTEPKATTKKQKMKTEPHIL